MPIIWEKRAYALISLRMVRILSHQAWRARQSTASEPKRTIYATDSGNNNMRSIFVYYWCVFENYTVMYNRCSHKG